MPSLDTPERERERERERLTLAERKGDSRRRRDQIWGCSE